MLICLAWNTHYLGIHSYVAKSEPTNDKMFILSASFENIWQSKVDGELTYSSLYKDARSQYGLLLSIAALIAATFVIPQLKKQLKAHPEYCI